METTGELLPVGRAEQVRRLQVELAFLFQKGLFGLSVGEFDEDLVGDGFFGFDGPYAQKVLPVRMNFFLTGYMENCFLFGQGKGVGRVVGEVIVDFQMGRQGVCRAIGKGVCLGVGFHVGCSFLCR